MSELTSLTIAEAREKLRAKEIKAVELTEAYISAIEAANRLSAGAEAETVGTVGTVIPLIWQTGRACFFQSRRGWWRQTRCGSRSLRA